MLATKPYLKQADVQKILNAADQHAAKNNWAVTIAVCDDGGHVLGLIRRDGCAPVSAYIAQEKARTSAMGKRESRIYEEIINNGRTSFLSVPHISGMLEGGVNIEVDGFTIGAVGVSGVKSVEDAEIAKAGIAALL
jgi:glc operon protein GlcG